ncbi:MAG: protein p60 precursor [Rhodococcus sp.]|nr:protein p60 precursor [Rhodococcus sp. (in: high G+C Gram-positive bacteria)]
MIGEPRHVAAEKTNRSTASLRAALTASVLTLVLVAIPLGPAGADPVVENPTEALNTLSELSRESEQTTEALHVATMELEAKQDERAAAERAAEEDQRALDAANAQIDQFRPTVDQLAIANYRGARTNRLFALMVSDSPQQLLDQMSALDVISGDIAHKVAQFKDATDAAAAAAAASKESADAARIAADQAKAVSDELQKKQSALQSQIADVTAAFEDLSREEKDQLVGTPFPPGFDPQELLSGLTPGAGSGALQAGLTRVGSPYEWGGNGPNAFDCSGLVVWAYKQIGKTLPRSSQAQAQGGVPVSRDQMQPGDVVIIYDDASHVGLYAGDGNILHASTFGVPVKVEPIGSMPFAGARRY